MARTLGINRVEEDPNNSVRAPIFSPQMVMLGCRPFHITSTRVFPEGSEILVRRRSGHSFGFDDRESRCCRAQCTDEVEGEGSEGERTTDDVPEKTSEPTGDGVLSSSGRSSVVISNARSPVETSMSDVLSMSGDVNRSSMMVDGTISAGAQNDRPFLKYRNGGRRKPASNWRKAYGFPIEKFVCLRANLAIATNCPILDSKKWIGSIQVCVLFPKSVISMHFMTPDGGYA
jgi:hypothetical protein